MPWKAPICGPIAVPTGWTVNEALVATRLQPDDFAFSVNGRPVQTDNSRGLPAFNRLVFRSAPWASGFNGVHDVISGTRLWLRPPANSELVGMTS